MPPRTVFFHVHVRKCGGSTFHSQILKRLFGDAFVRDSSLIEYQYSREQVAKILGNCPWLRAYSSHKISLDLPYDSTNAQVIAIAFVRSPIEQFCSHYRYQRNHYRDWDLRAKQMSLTEYIEHVVQAGLIDKQDQFSQLKQLAGARGTAGLSQARELAARKGVFVWPIERFDEACLCLERLFPDDLRDCHYAERKNQSTREQSLSRIDHERLESALGVAEFELWELAQQWIDEQLEQLFSSREEHQHALEEFRRRCAPRSWWRRLLSK